MPKGKSYKKRARKPTNYKAIQKLVKAELKKTEEIKYNQQNHQFQGISDAGTVYDITPVNQGTGDTQRIGDEIKVNAIQIRFQAIAGDTTNYLRIIVFQWIPNDAAVPAIGNILNSQGGSVPYITAFYNNDTLGNNYIVLCDKVYSLSQNGSNYAIQRNMYCPMKYAKKKVQFDAATTQGQQKFYVLAVSDSTASPHLSFAFISRMTYTDS